jgi:hypothetical protein
VGLSFCEDLGGSKAGSAADLRQGLRLAWRIQNEIPSDEEKRVGVALSSTPGIPNAFFTRERHDAIVPARADLSCRITANSQSSPGST